MSVKSLSLIHSSEKAASLFQLGVPVAKVPAHDDGSLTTANNFPCVELKLEYAHCRTLWPRYMWVMLLLGLCLYIDGCVGRAVGLITIRWLRHTALRLAIFFAVGW
jgi:hypothetical protein